MREVAEQAVRTAVQTKDNPADVINVALEELVRQQCERPGYTTLAATIRAEVNAAIFAMANALQNALENAAIVMRSNPSDAV